MSNRTLPEGYVSKRSISVQLGINLSTLRKMIFEGVLCESPVGGIAVSSLANLRLGEHYVICAECGKMAAQISPKHLAICSRLTLDEYRLRHPTALIMSDTVARHRAKTEEQKNQQSITLINRFRTAAGEITRKQISMASRELMKTPYRQRAVEHLKKLSQDPIQKVARSQEALERWHSGDQRKKVKNWHQTHKEESLACAAKARSHIKRTFTKPHKKVEEALLSYGLPIIREYPVGYYQVDEALPEMKLAIEVDGCYWHGCKKSGFNGAAKIIALDRRKGSFLRNHGWTVIKISEHEIKEDFETCIKNVLDQIAQIRNNYA